MDEGEKRKLEKYAIEYFVAAHPGKLKILTHSDKPDFTLFDEDSNFRIGVEVAHLWHDNEEAKILLNRSKNVVHGLLNAADLIRVLNELLIQKVDKISGFEKYDKLFLVIRAASPIFDKSTFDMYENDIVFPENDYNEIWLVLDDNKKSKRWSELKRLK